ncbi:MAG: cupin domain-containing protein [Proteobacteria bacterium]|nr:cupin domain-containing protein [Pseudomonadota bacterium]MDA1355099.1 cupin domain-containing protein [Pseudomonadota bacterium]
MADSLRLPALDPMTVANRREPDYPGEFKNIVAGRARRALGDAVGLQQFGVNLVMLAPGAASAQRHWHSKEDEFVIILNGEVVLISDSGEQTLKAGDTAGFPAGTADGHHLVNLGSEDARYLEIGSRVAGDVVSYPDIDLVYLGDEGIFTDKLGKAY